jgi:hypothetical protein
VFSKVRRQIENLKLGQSWSHFVSLTGAEQERKAGTPHPFTRSPESGRSLH